MEISNPVLRTATSKIVCEGTSYTNIGGSLDTSTATISDTQTDIQRQKESKLSHNYYNVVSADISETARASQNQRQLSDVTELNKMRQQSENYDVGINNPEIANDSKDGSVLGAGEQIYMNQTYANTTQNLCDETEADQTTIETHGNYQSSSVGSQDDMCNEQTISGNSTSPKVRKQRKDKPVKGNRNEDRNYENISFDNPYANVDFSKQNAGNRVSIYQNVP